MQKLYKEIATLFGAWTWCIQHNNKEWETKHQERINALVKEYMPHGSGIDNGVHFDFERSVHDCLVFNFGYHAMDEMGGYVKWLEYKLKVTPSLTTDFDTHIVGPDYQGVKEYLYDIFNDALVTEV